MDEISISDAPTLGKVCTVDGCRTAAVARGFCQKHYIRFNIHGDPNFVTARGTHGESNRGRNTAEYRAWASMKNRCYLPSQNSYPEYGGRGIIVCDRWLTGEAGLGGYECFLLDMGRKPHHGHTVDRIDGAGNYEPSNCRWASRRTQNGNRSTAITVSFNGRNMCLAEAAREAGLNPYTVRNRINALGWSIEKALSTPTHNPSQFMATKRSNHE